MGQTTNRDNQLIVREPFRRVKVLALQHERSATSVPID